MDGLSVIDKPAGPTSHDVVDRMRRVFGERRIGHAGTLDPAATGVLVLLVGRATRLAQFLSGTDKTYDAVVCLGQRTDTGDADGAPIGQPHDGPMPSRADIDRALEDFRGTFLQRPPAFSAKHVGGTRSHQIARSARRTGAAIAESSLPERVEVTAHGIEVRGVDGCHVSLRVECSAGFYVRSLADDLGQWLRTGGHLKSLRRTRSGDFGLDRALPLEDAQREPERAAAAMIPMAEALPRFPAVALTADGVRRVLHGSDLGRAEIVGAPATFGPLLPLTPLQSRRLVRLVDEKGELVAIGEPARTPGLLHPLVVLG
jgi:tRNA pseudouridine55 synthase